MKMKTMLKTVLIFSLFVFPMYAHAVCSDASGACNIGCSHVADDTSMMCRISLPAAGANPLTLICDFQKMQPDRVTWSVIAGESFHLTHPRYIVPWTVNMAELYDDVAAGDTIKMLCQYTYSGSVSGTLSSNDIYLPDGIKAPVLDPTDEEISAMLNCPDYPFLCVDTIYWPQWLILESALPASTEAGNLDYENLGSGRIAVVLKKHDGSVEYLRKEYSIKRCSNEPVLGGFAAADAGDATKGRIAGDFLLGFGAGCIYPDQLQILQKEGVHIENKSYTTDVGGTIYSAVDPYTIILTDSEGRKHDASLCGACEVDGTTVATTDGDSLDKVDEDGYNIFDPTQFDPSGYEPLLPVDAGGTGGASGASKSEASGDEKAAGAGGGCSLVIK